MEFPFSSEYLRLLGEVKYEKNREDKIETLVETTDQIMVLLNKYPMMTLADISVFTGKSLCAVERASFKLVKCGKIQYVGSKKNGHWEVIKE